MNKIKFELTAELKLQLKEAIDNDDYARATKLAEYLQMMRLEFGDEKAIDTPAASPKQRTGKVGRPRKNDIVDKKPPKLKRGPKPKKGS